MPAYRCGICNVFSSSLEQHARHLDGARHRRNEAAALQGAAPSQGNFTNAKRQKRAQRDAAAVSACLDVARATIAGDQPTGEWKERRVNRVHPPRLSVDGVEFDTLTTDTFARVSSGGFEALCVAEAAVGGQTNGNGLTPLDIRVPESTHARFFDIARVNRVVRVRVADSVVALIRADTALLRDGKARKAQPHAKTTTAAAIPWQPATDPATGRTYWYRARETAWEKPPDESPAAAAGGGALDWIAATVLTATGGDAADATRAVERGKAKEPLCATVSLIHGPPGTGKTTELARILNAEPGRVLCCATSNRAVNELCDRYHALGRRNGFILGVGGEGHARWNAAKSMGEREQAKSCAVVFCTLATAGRSDLRDLLRFRDLLVVDEAGQATEPDVISAADAAHASRLILCGDPLQLPPILNCRDQTGGLRVSALERLLDVGERDDVSFRFLDVQRRMHPSISRYPNGAYYAGRVADAEAVRTRDEPDWLADARRRDERLRELPPRSVLDTRGAMRRVGTSSANDEEVRVVVELVAALLRDAPRDADVAVISFYAAQVRALQDALEPGAYPGLRVGSVDAFQGSEADVVLISCVRAPQGGGSSDRGDDLGFVADERRFNVALTPRRPSESPNFEKHSRSTRVAARTTSGADAAGPRGTMSTKNRDHRSVDDATISSVASLSAARADSTDPSADNSAARRVTAFDGDASRGRSMSLNALATEHSIKNIAFVPASIGDRTRSRSAAAAPMRLAPLLALAAANTALNATHDRLPSGTAAALARLELIDAWLADGADPPAHWAVRKPGDVAAKAKVLVESKQKEVNSSWLSRESYRDEKTPVVVKALHKAGRFEFGHRESDIAYFELLYLELLRGEPGIPVLYGGWATRSHIVWVTSDGGASVGKGLGRSSDPAKLSKAYDHRARKHPIEVARAWFRCFRSFGERGGFVLTDFKPEQFTLDPAGDIYLVDGPAPNDGAIAAFARKHFTAGAASDIIIPGAEPRTLPRHIDLEPGAPWPCPADEPIVCAKRTYKQHHAPTATARRSARARLSSRRAAAARATPSTGGPVRDVASRDWLLPRVISLAFDRSDGAARRALREDARARPGRAAVLRRAAKHARVGPVRLMLRHEDVEEAREVVDVDVVARARAA
ncbi:hypothetical protein JL720_4267 [Aureococcus anophagefferens]|nr:hypothetical protein JL720_4267 [Aureococcus anophagefferens]